MKKYICLIPARAGSKRVPNKNILKLNDKPLIKHSIDFALQISSKSDIYVSTDSEIAQSIAKDSGVNIHKRPNKFSLDDTSMIEATLDFINTYEISEDTNLVLLQPTNPFRDIEYFNRLKKLYERDPKASSAISVVRCTFFHPSKIGDLSIGNTFKRLEVNPEHNIDNDKKRPYYVVSGSYYIVSIFNLIRNNSFIGNRPIGLEESLSKFCNIDTQLDFKIAELLAND